MNKKCYFLGLLLAFLLISSASLLKVYAECTDEEINVYYCGYKSVPSDNERMIIGPNIGGKYKIAWVTNDTILNVFIPTKTEGEWVSLGSANPSHIDICQCTGDSEGDCYIGQTSYFTSQNSCGNWDYNGDGSATKRYTSTSDDNSCTPTWQYCDGGWEHDYVRDCGVEAFYLDGGSHTESLHCYCTGDTRTQSCH